MEKIHDRRAPPLIETTYQRTVQGFNYGQYLWSISKGTSFFVALEGSYPPNLNDNSILSSLSVITRKSLPIILFTIRAGNYFGAKNEAKLNSANRYYVCSKKFLKRIIINI